MTSRERVLAAIEHHEPDRVPVDFGGTILSGISAKALHEFKKYKGLDSKPVKIIDLLQMLGELDYGLIDELQIDTLPLEPQGNVYGIKYRDYKSWKLFDGTEIMVPADFAVAVGGNGDWILHEKADPALPEVARMPKDGFFFDVIEDQVFNMDFLPPPLSEVMSGFERAQPDEATLEDLAERARRMRQTDKALILGIWKYIGPPSVGSIPDWLCLMMNDSEYVFELFERKAELDLLILENIYSYIGENADVLGIDGVDFGTQRAELFSPELFEQYHYPYYRDINTWVHENTNWKTWKHSCGSINQFLPYLVKSGLDCINPVQCSADGMSPEYLKEKYGNEITFWGGGADTQWTVPFGTPDEVYAEVRERLRIFMPGGGYVFNPIHNIQPETPPENVEAMFEAVKDFGGY